VDASQNWIYVILNRIQVDIFETTTKNKPGVAKNYGPDYQQSGFQFKVAKKKLREGRYYDGLLIAREENFWDVHSPRTKLRLVPASSRTNGYKLSPQSKQFSRLANISIRIING